MEFDNAMEFDKLAVDGPVVFDTVVFDSIIALFETSVGCAN